MTGRRGDSPDACRLRAQPEPQNFGGVVTSGIKRWGSGGVPVTERTMIGCRDFSRPAPRVSMVSLGAGLDGNSTIKILGSPNR